MKEAKLEERRSRGRSKSGSEDNIIVNYSAGHRYPVPVLAQQQYASSRSRYAAITVGVDGEKSMFRTADQVMASRGQVRGIQRGHTKTHRERIKYDTPFDKNGRCHYHVNVQLATKKFTGGWHILFLACPKCMEQKTETETIVLKKKDSTGSNSSFARSYSRGKEAENNHGQLYDDNGCCILHSHVQIASKKILGGGWKVTGMCPICCGGSHTSLLPEDDAHSVKSAKSSRSVTSRKSTRTVNTMKNTRTEVSPHERESSGKATSGRYGSLPFDSDGYCCHHPSVKIAERTKMGGYKVIHDFCPDCGIVNDRNKSRGRAKSNGRDSATKNRSKSRDGIRCSNSSSQQHDRKQNRDLRKQTRRGSITSDLSLVKHSLFSEFRM